MADAKDSARRTGAVALLISLDHQFLSFGSQLRPLGRQHSAGSAVFTPATGSSRTVLSKANQIAAPTLGTSFYLNYHKMSFSSKILKNYKFPLPRKLVVLLELQKGRLKPHGHFELALNAETIHH